MKDISWRDWGDEAFEESRRTGKPVLLSISAVWCHWCHVMDSTTYEDPEVVRAINERFIPVRVDNDRNPDINTRYNMGGWPSTVFLTSERDVLTGATYIPPDQMAVVLESVASDYAGQRDELLRKARDAREDREARYVGLTPGTASLDVADEVLRTVRSLYDDRYGGFGVGQKFPHISALELLLFSYETTGREDDLRIVTHTLDDMLSGEVFDGVEGGMFRYATRRDWTEPHYEKMLDDNARIAPVLLDAYRLSRNEVYMDAAQMLFSYLEKTLLDTASGAFFGSQDADEEYYKLDAEARLGHEPPRIDSAVYTDSNAALSRAYVKLWAVTGEENAMRRALEIVRFFNGLPRAEDGTVCHYYESGSAREPGNLTDQAQLSLANLVAYEAVGDVGFLDSAARLAGVLDDAFGAENGGLYDVSAGRALRRGITRYATPLAENSAAALVYKMLSDLTCDPRMRDRANAILDALAGQHAAYGIMAADYAWVVALCKRSPIVVTIPQDSDAGPLRRSALAACGMNCTVQRGGDLPGAIVCVGETCHARVTGPDDLSTELAIALRQRI